MVRTQEWKQLGCCDRRLPVSSSESIKKIGQISDGIYQSATLNSLPKDYSHREGHNNHRAATHRKPIRKEASEPMTGTHATRQLHCVSTSKITVAHYVVARTMLLCALHCCAHYTVARITLLCALRALHCCAHYTVVRITLLCALHCCAHYTVVRITLLCALHCCAHCAAACTALLCALHCCAHYTVVRIALLRALLCALHCCAHCAAARTARPPASPW